MRERERGDATATSETGCDYTSSGSLARESKGVRQDLMCKCKCCCRFSLLHGLHVNPPIFSCCTHTPTFHTEFSLSCPGFLSLSLFLSLEQQLHDLWRRRNYKKSLPTARGREKGREDCSLTPALLTPVIVLLIGAARAAIFRSSFKSHLSSSVSVSVSVPETHTQTHEGREKDDEG